jgi:cytochrome oxidase Cu insertion factor (SCO1/SenC/PrrC family)
MLPSPRTIGWTVPLSPVRTLSVLLALCLTTVPLAGQRPKLGPVDGAGLAATDTGRVTVGTPAPDFTLEAFGTTPITLSQLRGSKNVVLVFFRGHW